MTLTRVIKIIGIYFGRCNDSVDESI